MSPPDRYLVLLVAVVIVLAVVVGATIVYERIAQIKKACYVKQGLPSRLKPGPQLGR